MDELKAKLILNNFDGTMNKININPKSINSKIDFEIKYYNEDAILTNALITFTEVIAVDFQVNYFNNCTNSDLWGLYEIFDDNSKIEMIEKIFNSRLNGYLSTGDYNYSPDNENDTLNYRESINKTIKQINKYKLYQQNTEGGIYYILALGYEICV
ncbi:hypothetical protein [Clostridium sp.]|uniref:hypothetical protein n=1 Tax=Clostridium sp. TaxID=1506 RepID=UPI00290C5FDA|nr:hypothetical protein [Clostridium sp.]MDU5106472.1 hypothetical protein [Clostridium sp.]